MIQRPDNMFMVTPVSVIIWVYKSVTIFTCPEARSHRIEAQS